MTKYESVYIFVKLTFEKLPAGLIFGGISLYLFWTFFDLEISLDGWFFCGLLIALYKTVAFLAIPRKTFAHKRIILEILKG